MILLKSKGRRLWIANNTGDPCRNWRHDDLRDAVQGLLARAYWGRPAVPRNRGGLHIPARRIRGVLNEEVADNGGRGVAQLVSQPLGEALQGRGA